jgi:hypothetical protein
MTLRAFITTLILALSVGCGDSSIHILITVPTGYRGALRIYQRQPGGTPLNLENRSTELAFDSHGSLRLEGDSPSRKWHTMSSRFSDGTPIQVITQPQNAPPSAFGLWPLGGVRNNEEWFVIGTREDLEKRKNCAMVSNGLRTAHRRRTSPRSQHRDELVISC